MFKTESVLANLGKMAQFELSPGLVVERIHWEIRVQHRWPAVSFSNDELKAIPEVLPMSIRQRVTSWRPPLRKKNLGKRAEPCGTHQTKEEKERKKKKKKLRRPPKAAAATCTVY